jgi:hypothetical protein
LWSGCEIDLEILEERGQQTVVSDPNKSIIEYIDYYCDPKREFNFAVMIRGSWGAGKTYLIKGYIERRAKKPSAKTLYVSLYGFTSPRQIDDELYRQMHPILASKGMKLAHAVGKGILKGVAKIDLTGDGKEDLTITANVPDVDLKQFSKVPSECLLIFDDLERCSMKISDVLGYINAFVEHDGYKSIIIANEEAILNGPSDPNYSEIKEKLIGQTLTVRSDAKTALSHFLSRIRNRSAKQFAKNQIYEAQLIHSQSQTNNLRLMQHALLDFERLSSTFAARHWKNTEAIGSIFRNVMALSYEARSGRLKEADIFQIPAGARIFRRKEGEAETVTDLLEKRYPETDFSQSLISKEDLKRLLFDGSVEPKAIRQGLDENPYYASPETLPAWKVAWHGWEISDDDFESAVAKVEGQFKERKFSSPHDDLFQVFGLRLWLSNVGVIQKTRDEVVDECKKYIDDLKEQGRFPDPLKWRHDNFFSTGGLGVHERDSAEFKTIIDHYDRTGADIVQASLPAKGHELLDLMKTDVLEYFRALCLNNASSSPYYEIPILASIPPDKFVDQVIKLPISVQASVFSTFKGRYELGALDGVLKDEKDWLVQVKLIFEDRMRSMRPLSKYRLMNRIGHNIDSFL